MLSLRTRLLGLVAAGAVVLGTAACSTDAAASDSSAAAASGSAALRSSAGNSDSSAAAGSSAADVCVDQFGKTWPGAPDPSVVHYDDTTGLMWMDECGNSYGQDGKVVKTPDGVCVNGLAPGFENQPERNVCLDPSLVPDVGDLPGAELNVGVDGGVLHADVTIPGR
jgi:hypothetical protein